MSPRPKANRLALGLPYIAAIALAVLLYSRTFAWWYYEWTAPGSFYAHAMFVPFFVGIMLWRNRETLATSTLAALLDWAWLSSCRA